MNDSEFNIYLYIRKYVVDKKKEYGIDFEVYAFKCLFLNVCIIFHTSILYLLSNQTVDR